MKCPYCGSENLKVIDSRAAEDGSIRRRRECAVCRKRFTTYEKIESMPVFVVKKDNTREPFDRDKLIDRISRSTYKRPVSAEALSAIADEIEQYGQGSPRHEISSSEIGEMVMSRLKDIDEVSYVRFASVYREFKDVNSFMQELTDLMNKNRLES
ncbi:MAG: transcriptional repressor NrdR [Firmicutes bacterium]|nr:transcriptional repressor NrdR [Bacillota bacterium]MBQ5960116.1 transcriptional repressor NrdR [Bacillota bacterium]